MRTAGLSAGPSGGLAGGRDRATLVVYAVLLVLTVAAWAHVLTAMPDGDMAGMNMAMAPTWSDALAYVFAWAVSAMSASDAK